MNTFPLDRDTWYNMRDNRTNLVLGSGPFETFSVGIILEKGILESSVVQIAALTTVNILARWCRNISIEIPASVMNLVPGTKELTFNELIINTVFSADPYNKFQFATIVEKSVNAILVLGNSERIFTENVIFLNHSGWNAGIKYDSTPLEHVIYDDNNPIGAIYSACLGVSEVFRLAVGGRPTMPHSFWYSLYSLNKYGAYPLGDSVADFPIDLALGNIHQVGCGAVGSALDYFLGFTKWSGTINLIDYDQVDITNCNRSPIFNAMDGYYNTPKIDLCARTLSHTFIKPLIFDGDYEKYIGSNSIYNSPPDLILCLANERNIWNTIQQIYPPLVFHATTTPNWGINFGRHIPKKEWCILCRFSDSMIIKTTYQCSESTYSEGNQQQKENIGVLPFLSPTAAIFILAELAKLTSFKYPINKSFVQFNMKNCGTEIKELDGNIKNDCECSHQHINTYSEQIRQTKYWHFTNK